MSVLRVCSAFFSLAASPVHPAPLMLSKSRYSLWPIIFSLQVIGAQFSAMKWCSYFYYYSKATKDCTLCTDRCSPGTGLVRNCGYDDYGNRVAPACETCSSGYYSRIKRFNLIYRPSYPCARCRPCFPASRIKRSCSSTRDTKCARCPKGYVVILVHL